ncbi:MAG: PEP-CTERM sorting domain-containing protein [Acidobacteriaceae bacterium]|nr:PEP-CTERM sorting domain-containing protein [Acidobacteriaceae bacterium]
MRKFLWSLIVGLGLCSLASANITPTLVGGAPTASGSNFNYNYSVTLAGDQRLDVNQSATYPSPSGTFFTIYNFAGFDNVTSAPSGWMASEQMIGLTPSTVKAASNSYTNVSFSYIGPPSVVYPPGASNGNPSTQSLSLGNFIIGSSISQTTNGFFSAQATGNYLSTNGMLVSNYGSVLVPLGLNQPFATPEPASMALIGSGLVALAIFRRKLVRR